MKEKLADKIKYAFGSSTDLIIRPFIIDNREITLVMSEVLASSAYVNDFILRRLLTIKFYSSDIEQELLNFIPTNNGKVLENISDGSIILMHELYETSLEALEILLPKLYSLGYQVVSVGELAMLKDKTLVSSHAYRALKS